MASISGRGAKGHHTYTLTLTETSTSVANNTSAVSFSFDLADDNNWFWSGWNQSISYSVSANGAVLASGYIPNHTTKNQNLAKGSFSVPHNADGSKSIAYSFSVSDGANQYYTSGNASASGTMVLTNIPRASTISAVSGNTIGGSMTVTIARAVSSFTHQLWYKVGNSAWYDLGSGIGTSKAFTTDTATASQFPSATSGTLQLRLRTFNSGTVIGSDYYHNVTVNVPSYTPAISGIKLTGNNLLSGEYVQGKSTVTAEITASTLYGATIKSYSATVDGKTYSGSKFTSSALSSGSKSVSVTITDTRGKTATLASSAFTVRAYSNPTITEFTLARQSDGTTVIATLKGSVAAVNNKNGKTIQVTLNGVTQTITSSSYTISGTTTFTGVPTDNTLTSVAKITDSFTQATREFVLPTVAVTMDFHHSGTGVAFGKVAEEASLLDVNWKAKFRKELHILTDSFDGLKITRSVAGSAATINFLNGSGSLGYIGMTGTGTSAFLTRWSGDGKSGYPVLDTGNTKDHIVEQGTSGVWYYRKWNNGRMEVYGTASQTPTALNNGTNSITVTMPVSFVNTAYTVTITPAKCGLLVSAFGDCNSSNEISHTVNSFVLSYKYNHSVAYAANFNVVVVGKWK